MHWRFVRRIKLARNLRLNLSKSGLSLSLGMRGLWVTLGRRGTRLTAGLPGSGLSVTHLSQPSPAASPSSEGRRLLEKALGGE
jgi:hypothetical protein